MTAPKPNLNYPIGTKIAIVVVLVVAIGGFVVAGLRADTDNSDSVTISGAPGELRATNGVEGLFPAPDSEVLAQQRFGIDLAPGWTGELTFLPGNGAATVLPPEEIEFTALNELVYQPGDDKVLARLPQGVTSCVRATVWDQVRGRDATERLETWCFSVT